MVFDAFVEGCNVRFSCGYPGFEKFKCEIFKGWNEDLGNLFEEKSRYLWDEKFSITKHFSFVELMQLAYERENGLLGQKIKKILNEYDKPYNEGMKLFYKLGDQILSPNECKLILDAFNRVDTSKFDKSSEDDNEWLLDSYDTWKTMLKYAVDNNKNLTCG